MTGIGFGDGTGVTPFCLGGFLCGKVAGVVSTAGGGGAGADLKGGALVCPAVCAAVAAAACRFSSFS